MSFTQQANREKENRADTLKKRASTLSLSLRRVSASSFVSMRSSLNGGSHSGSHSGSQSSSHGGAGVDSSGVRTPRMSRFRDSFMAPRTRVSSTNLISLPTPVSDSRDKFQSKLRAQKSLLSLTDSEIGSSGGNAYSTQQRSLLEELLQLCDSQKVPLVEAPRNPKHANATRRIVDFGPGGIDLQQVVRELASYRCAPAGFHQTLGAYVVGEDPDLRLEHVLDNAGVPLSAFKMYSWVDAYSIFWQVVGSLAVAERRLQMEHRYLNPDNILIKNNQFTQRAEATITGLENARLRLPSGQIVCSRLDSPVFFTGEYRNRAVCRAMQDLFINASRSPTSPEWDLFMPRTNVFWLHALAEYLLSAVHGPDHVLRKYMQQVERRLRPNKRVILGSKDLQSAGEVAEWGDRVLGPKVEKLFA